ncbi:hypothetical protein [Thiosocius teredinicola]|uniref:hypothetical protein n=1 Tax=Thiosocius teredinicola TaxID=1973002 RepID=UPI0009913A6F
MTKIWLSVVVLIIALTGFSYIAYLSFSEHREYGKNSVEFYVLTPKELGLISELCKTEPSFSYSASDGPKPAIAVMTCELAPEEVHGFLEKSEFEKQSAVSYRRDDIEMNISSTEHGTIESIALLDYLKD